MNAKTCPTCQSPIPEHAPGGFCPACLLRDAAEPVALPHDAPSLPDVAAAFPKLEILKLIGHGGMGFVYQARQPELDRTVALKLLSPALRRDPAFEERFAREARVLGKLKHPNIVTLYEHGESGGYFYLMMEFVDGVNLRQAMSAGRFTPEQALAIVPAICDALQSAHAEGVWHRDIKPENILLDRDGRVKIADFGIARILGDPERNFTLTRTGGQLGSVAYMAPEQHEKPHTVDHRADIYSLGVVIYEMLTGELPLGRFPAPSQRAEVNARIDEIVMRTLEKERELRQQSAGEVKTEVEGASTMTGQDHRQTAGSNSGQIHPPLQGVPVKWLILAPSISLSVGIGLMLLNKAGVPMSPRFMQAVIPVVFFAVLGGGIAVMKKRGGGLQTQTPKASGLQWSFGGMIGSAIGSSLWMPMVAITSGWSGAGVALSDLTAAGVLLVAFAIWSNRHRMTPFQGFMMQVGAVFVASAIFLLGANWLDLPVRSSWPDGKMISAASLFWILLLIPALGVWGWFMHKIGNSRSVGSPGEKSEAGHPQSPKPGRFSRTAIVGACLIAVPFLQMLVVTGLAPRPGSGFGEIESWWVLALVSQKFIAVIVPILATLLGWIAVSQIRRSAGKLHGLWLAVFDGLFFPLLVLDFFLTLFFHSLGIACGLWTQMYDDRANAALIVWSCITWPIVDFFIIRRIWRTINVRAHTPAPQSTTHRGSESPVPLQPTIFLHALLFALVAAIFLFVLPRFAEIFHDMGVPRRSIPRFGMPETVTGILLPLVLFGVDVTLCFWVRKLGGRRGLRQWSAAVTLVMVAVVVIASVALYLPMKKLISTLGGPPTAEKSSDAEQYRDALNEKKQIEANHQRAALKKKFPDLSTPQGAVVAFHDGLDQHDIEAVLASIADQRLALAASPKSYAQELIEAEDGDGGVKGDRRTIIAVGEPKFTSASGVARLEYRKKILGQNPSEQFAEEECVKQGDQWRVVPDAEPTAMKPHVNQTSPDVESWSYTLRHLDATRLDAQMKANPQAGVATKVEAGVVTVTGRPDVVRWAATFLRAIDQPEVKDPLQLPLFNMPPDFFTRLTIPALMTGDELKDSQFEPAFFDTLKRENITAPQLARALRAHVLELEKATFVNTGTPFESIMKTPGASTYYDATIPCADQPDKPLTFRIRRTTQQIGTKPDIAGFAPWLIEEAKKQSKEPITSSNKGAVNVETGNSPPTQTPGPAGKPVGAIDPMREIIVNVSADGTLTLEGATFELKQLGEGLSAVTLNHKNQPIRIRADSKVSYQRIVEVMEVGQRTGFLNITFATASSAGSGGAGLETDLTNPGGAQGSDVSLSVEQKASHTEGTQPGENRTISIQAEKPGYVHIWTPGGKRFTEALNDNSQVAHIGFHSTTGFSSFVTYSLYQSEGPVLAYGIGSPTKDRPAQLMELAKQDLTYAEVAKGIREVRDPTGVCLRNTIYDLAPIGDSALLLAVTDTAEPPPETQYFLHIWQPPLQHAVPPQPGRPLESIPVRIGEMLITPGEPGKNVGNKVTGQRVGRISQRDGKYQASLQYSAGSTAMLNQPMTLEVPVAVSMHFISAGGMWPQIMLLSTKPDVTPFLKEEFFKPATAEEIQQGTTLAQQAAQLASTKGKVWKSGVLDMRRANGVQFQQILMLEFAPFAGQRENPPQASVKVASTSPTVKEGPITLSVGIGNADFSDVRLENKEGIRTIKITQAIETVDHPTKKTERILNDYRSMSFGYILTADTLTLKGFPTDEITWGSIGFIAPTRDIVFKLQP